MAKTIKRERQTVAALVDNDRVPVHVHHWLERYIAGDEHALEHTAVPQLDSTMEQVQLVYDVLDAQSQETGEHEFPEAARDFIEEYLYQLSEATGIRVWSDPDTAIAALPTMLQMTEDEGDTSPSLIALTMAIRSHHDKRAPLLPQAIGFRAIQCDGSRPPIQSSDEGRAHPRRPAHGCRCPRQT